MVYAGSGSGVALLGLRTRFRVVVGENLGLRYMRSRRRRERLILSGWVACHVEDTLVVAKTSTVATI